MHAHLLQRLGQGQPVVFSTAGRSRRTRSRTRCSISPPAGNADICARPPWPRPFQPAVGWQRHGHPTPTTLRRWWKTRSQGCDPHRSFTGGGEVARYIGRHGTKRVAKAVLIGAVPPVMLKSAANPGGLPMEAFDQIRGRRPRGSLAVLERPEHAVLRLQPYRRQGLRGRARFILAAGDDGRLPCVWFCIKAFSRDQPDRRPEALRRADAGAARRRRPDRAHRGNPRSCRRRSSRTPRSRSTRARPHGMCTTLKDRVNEELLGFLKA